MSGASRSLILTAAAWQTSPRSLETAVCGTDCAGEERSSTGPEAVVVVDRVGVAVPDGRMGVKMAMGFGTLAIRMSMTMMQIVHVPVLVGDGLVRWV